MIFIIKTIRILIGFVVFLLEIISGLGFSYAFLSLLKQEQNSFTIFISKYGNQILLIFGIFVICLLLPLEEYADSTTRQEELHDGSGNSSGYSLMNK